MKATNAADLLSDLLSDHGSIGSYLNGKWSPEDWRAAPEALAEALVVLLEAEADVWELLRVVAAERSAAERVES